MYGIFGKCGSVVRTLGLAALIATPLFDAEGLGMEGDVTRGRVRLSSAGAFTVATKAAVEVCPEIWIQEGASLNVAVSWEISPGVWQYEYWSEMPDGFVIHHPTCWMVE